MAVEEEKRYEFAISARCVGEGEDAPKMFEANVVYHNMQYEDVVLVEKHLIGVFAGLQQYAEARIASLKKT